MYSKRAGLILGFHGCDQSVRDAVVRDPREMLRRSENNYDWLGSGIYFWENNYERALNYAKMIKANPQRGNTKITTPSVVGAVIDLGYCLDLLDSEYLKILKAGYTMLTNISQAHGLPIPQNKKAIDGEPDLLIRHLDCAVIQTIHRFNEENKYQSFDSVRGVFFEGKELYPNAGFKEKNHIQIAVRNPNCIKGFFIPRKLDEKYPKP